MTTPGLGNRIYLDSNIFIYAFENSPTFQRAAQAVFQMVADGKAEILVSELIFPEILPKPLREGQTDQVDRYMAFLQNTAGVTLVPLSSRIVMRSVDLRTRYRLKTVDALHVATAIESNCTSFLSVDAGLARVTDIPVISLKGDASSQ